MWNLNFTPPQRLQAKILTQLPMALRRPRRSDWADANKPGHTVDSFLEGPCFDTEGRLYLTDIPHGRVFCVSPDHQWHTVTEALGWPNGLARHADGSLWVADHRHGILRLDPHTGRHDTVLGHRNSEAFKGVNDLVFDTLGRLYFTDQGQTGLHDPSGRVYRYDPHNGRLDRLLDTGPSPNGLALSPDEHVLFVAMTRANQVWRAPLLPDGSLSKMGAFQTFFGTSGPDGLAFSPSGQLVVAHASLGVALVLNPRGELTHLIESPSGPTVTNVAFRPGSHQLVLTESSSGTVLQADLPPA